VFCVVEWHIFLPRPLATQLFCGEFVFSTVCLNHQTHSQGMKVTTVKDLAKAFGRWYDTSFKRQDVIDELSKYGLFPARLLNGLKDPLIEDISALLGLEIAVAPKSKGVARAARIKAIVKALSLPLSADPPDRPLLQLPHTPRIAETMSHLDGIKAWVTKKLTENSKAFAFFTGDLSVIMIDSYVRSRMN